MLNYKAVIDAHEQFSEGVEEVIGISETIMHAVAREISAIVFVVVREGITLPISILGRGVQFAGSVVAILLAHLHDVLLDLNAAWSNYQAARERLEA